MKHSKSFLLGVLLAVAFGAGAAVFHVFTPATGVLVGNANSSTTTAATFPDSVGFSGGAISLVNDSATPGNSMLYGTNNTGVLGFYAQPTSGAATTGTFTGTLTGFASATTVTCAYSSVGGATGAIVSLFCPATSGTSNSTSMALTGVPSSILPSSATAVWAGYVNTISNSIAGLTAMLVSNGGFNFEICLTGSAPFATSCSGLTSYSSTRSEERRVGKECW